MRRSRGAVAALVVLLGVVAVGCAGRGHTAAPAPAVPDRGLADVLAGTTPGAPSWAPWPQALHDAAHSGAATTRGPRRGVLRWSRSLEGDVTPGPVVGADATIYAATNAGVLHALDPRTGQDEWTFDGGGGYGLDLSTSPAVLPDGLVLWPGPAGTLFALTRTGALAWRLELGGQVTSPAVLPDGRVYVGTTGGLLVALRPDEQGPGEAWRVDLGEQSYGSVVVSPDGDVVYQSVLSGVVAVRAGRVSWAWRVPRGIVEVSPAVAPDGTVVIGTNDPYEYALDPADGSVRWRHRRGPWTYSSPGVSRDGIVYFGDHADRVTGLAAATGDLVFSHQGPTRDTRVGGIGIWTSVLVDADHTTYVGTRQGFVYAVDRHSHRLWTYDAGVTVDSYPALTGDGALLIGTTDGRLLAFAD